MKKTFALALGLSTALVALPGMAQSSADWDADADQQLSEDEFRSGIEESGVFEGWDADSSGGLSSEELRDGLYGGIDTDSDLTISDQEWNVHSETFGSTYGDWTPGEVPGSDGFTVEDYHEAYESGGVYDDFDADASGDVSLDEFSNTAFGATDTNIDGWIAVDEGALFDKYWLVITKTAAAGDDAMSSDTEEDGSADADSAEQ